MNKRMIALVMVSALSAGALCTNARADDNLLGFYVGAGVGRSTNDHNLYDDDGFGDGYYDHGDSDPFGWKALVGFRPLPFLGAEAEYIDFGNAHTRDFNYLGLGTDGHVHDRAGAVFAVGYLPLPIPWFEPFVKVGWADVHEHQSYVEVVDNGAGVVTPLQRSGSDNRNGVAYGAGLQFHFGQLAVRAEYEQISAAHNYGSSTDPALLSVGVNWTF